MTIRGAIDLSTLLLLVVLALFAVIAVSARVVRRMRRRVLERSLARVTPHVMAVLADRAAFSALPSSGRSGRVVVRVVTTLLPQLRGADRDELAAILRQHGVLARAQRTLGSRRSSRRIAAAELLGTAGAEDAAVDIARLLHDRDRSVRSAAAQALGRLGVAEAAPALIDALMSGALPENTCAMALLRIGAPAGPALVEELRRCGSTRPVLVEIVGILGLVQARPLVEDVLVNAEGASARRAAARALGRLGMPESAPLLIELLTADLAHERAHDEELLIACVTALGQIGDRRAIAVLMDALARSHRVSFAAAGALAAMGPRRSRRSMRERANRTAPIVEILVGSCATPFAASALAAVHVEPAT